MVSKVKSYPAAPVSFNRGNEKKENILYHLFEYINNHLTYLQAGLFRYISFRAGGLSYYR